MMRRLLFFVLLVPGVVYAQLRVTLPAVPDTAHVRPWWRGYNQAASTPMGWMRLPHLGAYLSGLKPGIIRWPYGNGANDYRWYAHLDDTAHLHFPQAVNYYLPAGVALQLVVNFGNGTPSEAAEWVRFCNDNSPYYRALRDTIIGRPDPLHMQLWEIGNESTEPWSFAWSWLGYQDTVFGYQRSVLETPRRVHADSLYYYGGSIWRRGWVKVIGGLTPFTAILGHPRYYSQAMAADTIAVPYPYLDTTDPAAVQVFLAHNVDTSWALQQTNPRHLYDSIARPANLLPSGAYSWNRTHVFVHPSGGLSPNDVILIEYRSVDHAGAFAFRDSMKAADPSIRVGYTVPITPELEALPGFSADFAAHPPDFMITHQYASKLTRALLDSGYYIHAAYVPEVKIQQLKNLSGEWRSRQQAWNLPSSVPLALTEWNIALCDECPNPHPFDGIASALFVSDYWGRMVYSALYDSLLLEVADHFGLMASGNNFIHLLHVSNDTIVRPGSQGLAMLMTMEAIGDAVFPLTYSAMPTITIPWRDGNNLTLRTIDALSLYGGTSFDGREVALLAINRDTTSHTVTVRIPAAWPADSIKIASLEDSANYRVRMTRTTFAFSDTAYDWSLPAYSLNLWKIYLTDPVTSMGALSGHSLHIVPTVTDGTIRIAGAPAGRVEIWSIEGKLMKRSAYMPEISVQSLPAGRYLVRLIAPEGVRTGTFIRR